MAVAPRIDWKVPVDFWDLGEGVGMLRRAGGGLEKKFRAGWISRQEGV